jgi:hypothetical protein
MLEDIFARVVLRAPTAGALVAKMCVCINQCRQQCLACKIDTRCACRDVHIRTGTHGDNGVTP